MRNCASGNSCIIPPTDYPVLPAAAGAALSRALRNPKTIAAVEYILADGAAALSDAVQLYVDRAVAAAAVGDYTRTYDEAHEIRGLAGNAGLTAAAIIAGGLCCYLDAVARAGREPENAVVQLHMEAVARAARAKDEATRLGDSVARGLAELVAIKIAGVNAPETNLTIATA